MSRRSHMSSSGFSFGTLYDSVAPEDAVHWGRIECHCGHHANETVQEAKANGRIHLNGECLWSCCHANWSDFVCKAAISHEKGIRSSSKVMEMPAVENNDQKKIRRFLPTFFTQELICLSCFKPYKRPMKLTCGHSFCSDCIEKMVQYQKAAGSFSSRFRPAPPETDAAAAAAAEENTLKNLRLRQLSRSQRRALMKGDKDDSKMTDGEEKVNNDFVMCPVCSVCSYVRNAVEDVELVEKMHELSEKRSKGVRPKCSFCTSAVLAGAQAGEAEDATLTCSTCGPICARHHALLHIAGPPTFRCHEVNEAPMDLIAVNAIPHSYEICPKHGCEMDLYDKAKEAPVCELCVSAFSKKDIAARIIREEDKMAYFMEKEAKKAKEEDAKMMAKKTAQEREEERKKNEIREIASLHESLNAKADKCREIIAKSQALHKSGVLTKDVKGLAEMREEVKKIFADSHKALEEMQKQAEESIDKMIADADQLLSSRYQASETLIEAATDASARASSISLESKDVRAMVVKRLKDLQSQLNGVESLPNEPLEVSALLTMDKPGTLDKVQLVRIQPNNKGLFAAAAAAAAPAAPSEPESPEPMEDEDEILERIRAKLKAEEDSSRRSRENGRYSTIRSAVSSDMDDEMKRQAIGAIIFERGMDVLGVEFDTVFSISAAFLEKNSVDHILSDLSSPADFNRELRAIYEFLKETKKL